MFSWNVPPMTTTEFCGQNIGNTHPCLRYIAILPLSADLQLNLFQAHSIDLFTIWGSVSPFKVGQHQRIPSATILTLMTTWA